MTPGAFPRSGRQTAFFRLHLAGTGHGPDDLPNRFYGPGLYIICRQDPRIVIGLAAYAAEIDAGLADAWAQIAGPYPATNRSTADVELAAAEKCVAAYARSIHPTPEREQR